MSNSQMVDSVSDKLSESADIRADRLTIIKVALPVPVRSLFDYSLPSTLPVPRPGCRVRVGFGSRVLTGLVIDISDSSSLDMKKLKFVEEILDSDPLLQARHIEFLSWVADYYLHPPGDVYFSALP